MGNEDPLDIFFKYYLKPSTSAFTRHSSASDLASCLILWLCVGQNELICITIKMEWYKRFELFFNSKGDEGKGSDKNAVTLSSWDKKSARMLYPFEKRRASFHILVLNNWTKQMSL